MEKYRQLSAALKIEYCNITLKAHYITNEHAMLQKGNNSKCTEYLLPHAVMKPDVTDISITVRFSQYIQCRNTRIHNRSHKIVGREGVESRDRPHRPFPLWVLKALFQQNCKI